MIDPAARELLLLWGPMGAGKTTVGRSVARRIGVPFIDLDQAIHDEAGLTVAEIFAREGEAGFRARERAALEALLERGAIGVVALGGGTLCDDSLRAQALASAFVVTLTAPAETLLARVAGSNRPLLQVADPKAVLGGLLEARDGAYRSAHALVSAEGSAQEVGERLLAAWQPWR